MADNPGILIPRSSDGFQGDGYFNFVRPGTIVPEFSPPIIGYHDDLEDEGGLGLQGRGSDQQILKRQGIAPRNAYPFNTNKGIRLYTWYDLFWRDALHIVHVPPRTDVPSGWQAWGSGIDFDAGNVLSTVETQYEIFNGSKSYQTENDTRVLTDLQGVNEIAAPALPTSFAGLESRVYTVQVTTIGPAVISGFINHTFDNEGSEPRPFASPLRFNITGNRLLLLAFEPQRGVVERWDWVSDVLQSADGAEQRFSLRQLPKQSFGFTYVYTDETINRKLENFLRSFGTLQIGVPDWLSLTESTAAVNPDDTTVDVISTLDRDFRPQATGRAQNGVVMFTDQDNFEAQAIDTFTNTQITVVNKFLQSWPAGTTVMPFKVGYLRDNWRQRLAKVDRRQIQLQFEVVDGGDFEDETGFTLYQGRPVFEDVLGLEQSNDYGQTWQWQMIQRGGRSSRQTYKTLRRFPAVTKSFALPWSRRSEFIRARNWLFARRGRVKDFWLPSWRDDLPVVDDAIATAEIRVVKANYENVFNAGLLIDIRVAYTDGTFDLRRITAVDTAPGAYDELTPDTNFSKIPTTSNVVRVEFLTLHRLNTDAVQFVHEWVQRDGNEMTGQTVVETVEVLE